MSAQVQPRERHSEISPRSGTQAMDAKADKNPVNAETAQPQCKLSIEKACQHVAASCSVLGSTALQFVVSGAVAYVVASMHGQKAEDTKSKLEGLVSEANVKKSMAYAMLATSAKLASRIASNGTSALPNAVALRGMIQTSDDASVIVAQVIAELKASNEVKSFNTLNVLLGIEQKWTKAAQAAEVKAKAESASSAGKAKRSRKANTAAIERAVTTPSVLRSALHIVAGKDMDSAVNAILSGIARLDDKAMLNKIMEACKNRLASLNTPANKKAEPPLAEVTQAA